jgi:hypothetical protein
MPGPEQEPRNTEWRQRLAVLGQEKPTDARREARAVEALKRAGVLRTHRRYSGFSRLLIAAAAGLVLFLAGSWWGRQTRDRALVAQGQRFALFLLEDSTFQGTEQVGHDSLVAEYSAWAGELAASGNLILGEELGARVWPLGLTEAAAVPAARITGFFVLSATTQTEALAIARSCPHLRHGGGIVVRPIVPT